MSALRHTPPPPKSRHRWFIVLLLGIVLLGGVVTFVFSGGGGETPRQADDYQIVDITVPPPPLPPPPEEQPMDEPPEPEENIEPLEKAAGPANPADDSAEMDLGLDIGDLATSTGSGFVMDIPRFGRGPGGGGDGAESLLGEMMDSPPSPVNKTPPTYPPSLLGKGVGGRVLVTCAVDDAGQVAATSIKQSSGHPDLDKAALAAVNKWKFQPASKAGRKVKATCVVPFNFEVKKN